MRQSNSWWSALGGGRVSRPPGTPEDIGRRPGPVRHPTNNVLLNASIDVVEHETRFELIGSTASAIPSRATPSHTRGLTAAPDLRSDSQAPPAPRHVGSVLRSLISLMFTRFTVRRGACRTLRSTLGQFEISTWKRLTGSAYTVVYLAQRSFATGTFHELIDCVEDIGDKPNPVSLCR